jgi:asparagine synthase (glutamine-hydrolysing)
VKSYWDGARPQETEHHVRPEEEVLSELESLLQESVRLRLISDVPLGAFLSGGIDSSLVVAMMARQMTQPVKTFSIGFEEEAYNELPYARQVAQRFKTDHHELIVGPQGCDLIETIVMHFDEPMADPSAIPTYALSKLTAGHVKVALSGDGGDELFAGYDRYRLDLNRSRFESLPGLAKGLLGLTSDLLPDDFHGKRWMRSLALPAQQRYLNSLSYLEPQRLHRMINGDFLQSAGKDTSADRYMTQYFERVHNCPWLSQLQYVDTKTYLPADVLTKVDRMSMAHSLEVRGPFLDQILIEFTTGLPPDLKFRNGTSKYLLKRLAQRILPPAVVERRKQGFGVPLEYWFKKKNLNEYVRDTLFNAAARQRNILSIPDVEKLVKNYECGKSELAATIWLLVIFETWCRLYLDKKISRPSQNRPLSLMSGGSHRAAALERSSGRKI